MQFSSELNKLLYLINISMTNPVFSFHMSVIENVCVFLGMYIDFLFL